MQAEARKTNAGVRGTILTLQPFKHKLLALTGTAIGSIEDASVERQTLAPVLRQTVQPAIYLPSDLDRVTGAWWGSTIRHETELLQGGTREHAATIAYHLRDVDVFDGALFSGRWKQRLVDRKAAWFEREPERRLSSGTLACTWTGNHFFGHWITDDLTLYLAARDIGDPFVLDRKQYLHEPGYRRLLDVPREPAGRAHFDRVTILQDFGQNEHKRKRYEILRSLLRAKMRPAKAKRILLRRGNLGESRAIVNAPEFEAYLESQGFAVIEPEKLTASEIVERTMGAELVIGVEGSQIPHALLTMADHGVMCCIQPPGRFNNTIKGYTDCMGGRYAILVGHAAPGGFRMDIDDLKRLIEKIDVEVYRH